MKIEIETDSGSIRANPCCMAFSSDGSMLVVGYWSAGLALWDGRSGYLKSRTRKSYVGTLISFSFSNSMVVYQYEQDIQLWGVSSDSLVHIGELNHDDKVLCFSLSFDEKMIASSSGAGKVILWSVDKRERLHQLQAPENSRIRSIVFTPEDVVITIDEEEGAIRSWEGRSGKFKQLVVATTNGFRPFILCSPNGDYLVSAGHRVALWRKVGSRFKETSLDDAHHASSTVSFSRDGKGLAAVLKSGQMRIWNTETGRVLQNVVFGSAHWLVESAISHTLDRVVVAGEDAIVRLYTTSDQILLENTPKLDTTFSSGIELSPNQEFVVVVTWDYSLQLWSASTGKSIGPKMIGHTAFNTTLAFSPDSRIIASGSNDGQVRLWTAPDGEEWSLMNSNPTSTKVVDTIFSPNGEILAAGWEQPGLVHVWNIMPGSKTEPLFCLVCRDELVALAFSYDGELVVGAEQGYIEIWYTSDGSILHCIEHMYSRPTMVALSPEKDRVAMLHYIEFIAYISIWDLQGEPQQISTINTEEWRGSYLSMAPNGYLVYGSSVWDTRSKDPDPINWLRVRNNVPESKTNPRTLLSYHRGWVYSAASGGKLLAIPRRLGLGIATSWSAQGNIIAFTTSTGKPLIVDCSPMLEL
jgi:WD40 repeat protein